MSESLFSISFYELCQHDDIESHLVIEIVEYGIVIPLNREEEGPSAEQWRFDTDSVYWLKKALRIHQDLEIDWVAVAMVIDLMQQKEALQKENKAYQRQLHRFVRKDDY
ncbi:chaperone modulator CbpM [bacterium]|nr:chaperone modulator CbpM [bacterium]